MKRQKLPEHHVAWAAERLEVSPKTLKNWESRKLISKPRVDKFGWRVWTDAEFKKLKAWIDKNHYFRK